MSQSEINVSALLYRSLNLALRPGILSLLRKYLGMSFTKCKTSFPTRRLSFRAVKRTNSIGFLQVSRDSSNLFNELSRKPFCFSGRFARVLEVKLQEVSSCSCRRSVFSFTMFPLAKNALSRLGGEQKLWAHLFQLPLSVVFVVFRAPSFHVHLDFIILNALSPTSPQVIGKMSLALA